MRASWRRLLTMSWCTSAVAEGWREVRGKAELQQRYTEFFESLGENPEFETHDILANDEHGVLLQFYRGTKEGKTLEARSVGIVHFRDGKISEAWFFDDDPYTADPFYDA